MRSVPFSAHFRLQTNGDNCKTSQSSRIRLRIQKVSRYFYLLASNKNSEKFKILARECIYGYDDILLKQYRVQYLTFVTSLCGLKLRQLHAKTWPTSCSLPHKNGILYQNFLAHPHLTPLKAKHFEGNNASHISVIYCIRIDIVFFKPLVGACKEQ